MDARTYFLMLHDYAHSRGGKPRRVLADATPEQWRMSLSGHNPIAWIVWHIARGEDWAVNTMLRGDEQLLTRNGWDARMGEPRRDFGGGMTPAEVADLSARIDLDGLRGYYDAVTEETRRFVDDEFDFDTMHEPIDLPRRLALAPDAPGGSELMQQLVEMMTTRRQWLNTFTIVDVFHHFDEADHVFRLIVPNRQFP